MRRLLNDLLAAESPGDVDDCCLRKGDGRRKADESGARKGKGRERTERTNDLLIFGRRLLLSGSRGRPVLCTSSCCRRSAWVCLQAH